MKLKFFIFILATLLLNLPNAVAEENKYGIVEAWFNGKNATVDTGEDIKLKIEEPTEIKITATSKVNGHVFIVLTEPGVTKAFNVISGPARQDERIDNLNIEAGWSKTYTWIVTPNGAWKNGNAPINIVVNFYNSNKKESKVIQFTIANPYILDEQYTGSPPTTPPASSAPAPSRTTPFPSALFALAALLAVRRWGR